MTEMEMLKELRNVVASIAGQAGGNREAVKAERRVTLAGHPVQLTAIEYGLLFELSANAGRVMTYDRLLQRVWGLRGSGDSRRVRTAAKQLRRKLGDDANNPTYILNEPRVGYRMEKGEAPVEGTDSQLSD